MVFSDDVSSYVQLCSRWIRLRSGGVWSLRSKVFLHAAA